MVFAKLIPTEMTPEDKKLMSIMWPNTPAKMQGPMITTPIAIKEPFVPVTTQVLVEQDPNGRDLNAPGAKADSGKSRVWLCVAGFSRALEEVAKITTVGADKYTPNGWVEVPDAEKRYMDAFGRHMLALGRGEVFDTGPGGTGGYHKAQMIWNLLATLELELRTNE